jgi:hypothetical protein
MKSVTKKVMMQWYSTSDRLPEHEQDVLIYCHGQYNLAKFSSTAGGFMMKGGAFFHLKEWNIAWTKLHNHWFSENR